MSDHPDTEDPGFPFFTIEDGPDPRCLVSLHSRMWIERPDGTETELHPTMAAVRMAPMREPDPAFDVFSLPAWARPREDPDS